jgi:hypothetical protein
MARTSRSSTAREGGKWLERLARLGYLAKGVVYIIVGVLGVQMAFGAGQSAGSRQALREIAREPFGQTILVITALGLFGYAAWRFLAAVYDPGQPTNEKRAVKRLGYAVSGFLNATLALYALRISTTLLGGGGGGTSKQGMTAQLMAQPFGRWLVGLLGAAVVGVGGYHIYKAVSEKFMKKYQAGQMNSTERTWSKRTGKLGLSARGVTLGIIGAFLIQAAMTASASQAGGLGDAFRELLTQPYGPWLLTAVALGFMCYGVFCFSFARYRHFQRT